jgi:hypothetical protein
MSVTINGIEYPDAQVSVSVAGRVINATMTVARREPPGLSRNRRARERWVGMTVEERRERRWVRRLGENTLRAVNADRARRGLPPDRLRRAP